MGLVSYCHHTVNVTTLIIAVVVVHVVQIVTSCHHHHSKCVPNLHHKTTNYKLLIKLKRSEPKTKEKQETQLSLG